ncbi:hypothetical protein BDR03DRAFT_960909, partial [Suillus americanus]
IITLSLRLLPSFSETVAHSPTLKTTEGRFRKEFELDRKDAECELSRYEDAGVLFKTAERTTDIIRFWEIYFCLQFIRLTGIMLAKRTYISASISRRYGRPACSSFICAFGAQIFIQQRNLHSTAQQLISNHN